MNIDVLDLRRLRLVLAIQQHGSFAKAAEALHISQPSLSKSVARLEDQLKASIFLRTARGSELTPLGELIAQRAQRLLHEGRNLNRDVELAAGGEAVQLRLGVGALLGSDFLPRFLSLIADRHVHLRLAVESGDADDLIPLLATRDLDLVFCALGTHVARPPLVIERLFDTEMIAVVAPHHPLVSAGQVLPGRLKDFRCAGVSTSAFRNTSLFEDDDAESLSAFMANDYRALIELASTGHCVLVGPALLMRRELASGRLVRLQLDWSRPFEAASVTTPAGATSPIVSKIIAYAHELVAQLEAEVAPNVR